MKINLYLASEYEYRRGLVHKLLAERVIDYCLTDNLNCTDAPEHDDRIDTIDVEACTSDNYEKIIDMNSIPALSRDILEKMLPYESMAIKMGMRATNYPVSDYEESKRQYLRHLRYWNYIFDLHNINFIIHHCTPHSMMKYVIYGLAKVRSIPMLIWEPCMFFSGIRFYGADLESVGSNIQKHFEANRNSSFWEQGEDYLNDTFKSFWDRKTDLKLLEKQPDIELMEKDRKNTAKLMYEKYEQGMIKLLRKEVKYLLKRATTKRNKLQFIDLNKQSLLDYKHNYNSISFFKKNYEVSLDKYNKIAESHPDYSKKYIYFGLQLTPEASTLPLAGAFAEQYTSIQLLARAAQKNNVFVYVKEHFVQSLRSRVFYEDIRQIPNVVLIDSRVSAAKLIYNSIAVASQTGSCLVEGILYERPAIAIGKGYFCKGIPGLYELEDEEQGSGIIEEILSEKVHIDLGMVKRYFYSMQSNCITDFNDAEAYEYSASGEKKISFRTERALEERVLLIKEYVKNYYSD